VPRRIGGEWRQSFEGLPERPKEVTTETQCLNRPKLTIALRKAGWSDRDILDIVHVCAYFNFRVRIVDGLGLKLTEDRYEAARANRSKAAAMAKEKGAQLAPDIWGISRELGE
jgi:hypothetical protein